MPFQPVSASDAPLICFTPGGADDDRPVFHPTTLWVELTAGALGLRGCGLEAAITLEGTVLDESPFGQAARDLSGGSLVEPYADGGIVATLATDASTPGFATRSILYDRYGAVAQTFDHPLLDPLATDGTDTQVRLVGGDGTTLRALGPDGTQRWEATVQPTAFLVRAGGVAVVMDASRTLTGLDLRTGDTLWTSQDLQQLVGGATFPSQYLVPAAFTDGRTGLLLVANPDPAPATATQLLAVDLRTGHVRWQQTVDSSSVQLHAVRGHLIEQTATIVQTQTSDNGVVTEARDPRVRALR